MSAETGKTTVQLPSSNNSSYYHIRVAESDADAVRAAARARNQRRGVLLSVIAHAVIFGCVLYVTQGRSLDEMDGPISIDIGLIPDAAPGAAKPADPTPPTPTPPTSVPPTPVPPTPQSEPDEPDEPAVKPVPTVKPVSAPSKPLQTTDTNVKIKQPKPPPKKADAEPKEAVADTEAQRIERMRKSLKKVKLPEAKNTAALAALDKTLTGMRSSSAMAERLSGSVRNVAVSMPSSAAGNDGGGGGGANANPYLSVISALLHQRWEQPNRSEVGKGNPVTMVRLVILPDGTVKIASLVKRSGSGPMDGSVERMLKELKKVPGFSSYGLTGSDVKVDVQFALD